MILATVFPGQVRVDARRTYVLSRGRSDPRQENTERHRQRSHAVPLPGGDGHRGAIKTRSSRLLHPPDETEHIMDSPGPGTRGAVAATLYYSGKVTGRTLPPVAHTPLSKVPMRDSEPRRCPTEVSTSYATESTRGRAHHLLAAGSAVAQAAGQVRSPRSCCPMQQSSQGQASFCRAAVLTA